MSDQQQLTPPPVPPTLPVATLSYQGPQTLQAQPGTFWCEGMTLRVTEGAVLPCRCVKCNGTDDIRMKAKKFAWHPRWVLWLILINLLVCAIVALCLQKKVTVTYGLCSHHRKKLLWNNLAVAAAVLVSIALWIVAGIEQSATALVIGLALFLATIIYAVIACPVLKITNITNQVATFKGPSADFLASLNSD